MLVYRASRKPRSAFRPLDASASVAGDGWRFNDKRSAILYAAEVQSLAILEVVSRPAWTTLAELIIAAIEVPERSVQSLDDLGLLLPTHWNVRPAGPNARSIGGEFLKMVDQAATEGRQICGVRVPSVLSTTDCNVLLDPRQHAKYTVVDWARIPSGRKAVNRIDL